MNLLRLVPLAIGGLLGLVCVGLGVTALVTTQWITLGSTTYSLLIANGATIPQTSQMFQAVQGLLIGGVGATALGLLAAIAVGILVNNRWIRLLPHVLLLAGPIALLVGLILYFKIISDISGALNIARATELKFSFIFMLVSCILGFVLSTYFALVNSTATITPATSFHRRSVGSMYAVRF